MIRTFRIFGRFYKGHIERAKHPAYGYFAPREEYFQSIIDWQTKRNGVTGLTKEHIGYKNGVKNTERALMKWRKPDGM